MKNFMIFFAFYFFSMSSFANPQMPQVEYGLWNYKSQYFMKGKPVDPTSNLQSLSKSMPSGMGNNPQIMKQMEQAIKDAQDTARKGHTSCYTKEQNSTIFDTKIPGCEPMRIVPAGKNKYNVTIFCEGQVKCSGTLDILSKKKITGTNKCAGTKDAPPGMFTFDKMTFEGNWISALCPKTKVKK